MSTPQTEIPKKSGGARGAYYEGLLATLADPSGGKVVAIFAGDIETLRAVWDRVSTDPLEEAEVQKVAMFSQAAVTEIHSSVSMTIDDTYTTHTRSIQEVVESETLVAR